MANTKSNCVVISDFNAANLGGYLRNDGESPTLQVHVAPFGQPIQALADPQFGVDFDDPDFLIVWTQPQNVVASFRRVLEFEFPSIDRIIDEVDEFAAHITNAARRVKYIFVPTWVIPTYIRGFGLLDLEPNQGITDIVNRMNLRLSERLTAEAGVFLMNTQRWIATVGKQSFNPKLWYLAKVPFSNDVFKEALNDIKAALSSLNGEARKLIIVDLDDTLWGGTVGDVGWENLRLGGHDYIGEAHSDFQRALKALANRGVLLAIASKNEESIALEAITNHPEMVLRIEDFAGWRINWEDKAMNIAELVSELNLGLKSAVVLDDNPVERARIREALAEVLVPELPEDPSLFPSTLLKLNCFDTAAITHEDRDRTKQYESQRQRQDFRLLMTSSQEWLQKLGITVRVEDLSEGNIKRIVQLMAKTSQMNLRTRRLSDLELRNWMAQDNHKLWAFRVSDRFGDSGLTGVVSLEHTADEVSIVDFVLSCRVMGRGIEEAMLVTAIDFAQSIDAQGIRCNLVPTEKNMPCQRFFEESNLKARDQYFFTWNPRDPYLPPAHLRIQQSPSTQELVRQLS